MGQHDRTGTPRHSDPETLTLAALGEPALSGADAEHLLGCRDCAEELAGLRATVELARGDESGDPVAAVDPPERVWTAVAEELGLRTAPRRTDQHDAPGPVATESRFRRWLPAAAAAVVIAVGSAAVGAALTDDDPPGGSVAAEAQLAALPGSDRSGTARWLDTADGAVVHVELAGSQERDGYLEVWLLDPDSERLVSLGALPSGSSTSADLRVPAGIVPDDYAFVDVSVEALDGDPTHSGVSVARGDLVVGG